MAKAHQSGELAFQIGRPRKALLRRWLLSENLKQVRVLSNSRAAPVEKEHFRHTEVQGPQGETVPECLRNGKETNGRRGQRVNSLCVQLSSSDPWASPTILNCFQFSVTLVYQKGLWKFLFLAVTCARRAIEVLMQKLPCYLEFSGFFGGWGGTCLGISLTSSISFSGYFCLFLVWIGRPWKLITLLGLVSYSAPPSFSFSSLVCVPTILGAL